MKHFKLLVSALALMTGLMTATSTLAQSYQAKLDTAWGGWCYKFQDGKYYSKNDSKSALTSFTSPTTGLSVVYYLRIPETGARADFVYTSKYARMPKITLTVTRVSTGDTLCVSETQNTSLALTNKEIKTELLPYTRFPADEYYRFELNCDNWSYMSNIKYFLFQRTATLPILQHPQGGYGQHLFTWGTTIPEAPVGQAYDWAYQEVLVPRAYQHPADYYCTIAANSFYCGIQSVGRVGDNFNRTVLFSCWDSGNTDEDPNLPQYLRAKVYDYNHMGVSGHGGGEGSSGTIQLNNETYWWRSDEWVQFLVNARPENATEIEKNHNSGEYEEHKVENTLVTVWYKMASDSAWTYLATIRETTKNQLIGSWYSFIENFGGGEGHEPHKVYYRHGYMRSAASGKWYNRNKVGFSHYGDRTTRTDRYSGTTNLYENAFQMTYGGWGLPTDSSNVAGLPKNDLAVDTINLDPLNKRVDQAAHLWRQFSLMEQFNRNSTEYTYANWSILSSTGSNAVGMLNENSTNYWESNSSTGHSVVLKSKTGVVPITSFRLHQPEGYNARTRYVDAYTSTDGENWTLGAKDVFINNEDDNEITLPTTLHTEYLKLFFHEQINSHGSPRLKISTLAIRGDYDIDKIKAVAKEIIVNENGLQFYKTEDIAQLKAIYNNGACTDTDALSAEIRHIYHDCFPLMYGRISNTNYITINKAYLLQNISDLGFICAEPSKGITAKGATASAAKDYAKVCADVTDPNNTWQIIRSEKFTNAYVYNIGLKKYLNPEGEGWLSDTPYPFSTGISGKGCTLRSIKEGTPEYNKYLNINTALDEPFYWGNLTDNARFMMLDNYYMRPENAEALAVAEKSYLNERLDACKKRYIELLDVPEGRVGSIESNETKATLETLYNGGDVKAENIDKFIQEVENIKLLDIDTEHVYTFTSTSGTTTPVLAISSNGLGLMSKTINKPGQIWHAYKKGDGAVITSQGKGLSMLPTSTSGSPKAGNILATPCENASSYYLTEKKPGVFNYSDHSYPTYALGINGSSVASVAASDANAMWNIDVATEFSVRLNSVGVTSLYVDFDIIVGEGQEVYTANHITQDGVIKLSPVTGVVPALTPVLIKGDSNATLTFAIAAPNAAPYDNNNKFSGSLLKNNSLKKNEYYTLKINENKPMMKKAILSGQAADNEIYIVKTESMPDLQYYTFDFDDLIDNVDDATAENVAGNSDSAYDLQGRPTEASESGLYIINHKVVKK